MSTDDVILNKVAIIERCVGRVREEHAGDDRNITKNITRQDSIVLNIQRACEASVDLAMHLVRIHRLGIPQDSRDAFDLLVASGRLSPEVAEPLGRMVGFRNVAVHDYQKLSLDVVRAIVHKHLEDLLAFTNQVLRDAKLNRAERD